MFCVFKLRDWDDLLTGMSPTLEGAIALARSGAGYEHDVLGREPAKHPTTYQVVNWPEGKLWPATEVVFRISDHDLAAERDAAKAAAALAALRAAPAPAPFGRGIEVSL